MRRMRGAARRRGGSVTRKELEAEVLEQARLNGMGSEREARLMAQVEEGRREIARLSEENVRVQGVANVLNDGLDKKNDIIRELETEVARLTRELAATNRIWTKAAQKLAAEGDASFVWLEKDKVMDENTRLLAGLDDLMDRYTRQHACHGYGGLDPHCKGLAGEKCPALQEAEAAYAKAKRAT
jgi:chromosome segregation ATPase